MARFVQPELIATRQSDLSDPAPRLLVDRRGGDALAAKLFTRGVDVVAHQIELVELLVLGRVHGELGGRGGEDQPAAADVHRRKAQYVAEKSPRLIRLLRIDQGVQAENGHRALRLPGAVESCNEMSFHI